MAAGRRTGGRFFYPARYSNFKFAALTTAM
jgi:hypothetical protein